MVVLLQFVDEHRAAHFRVPEVELRPRLRSSALCLIAAATRVEDRRALPDHLDHAGRAYLGVAGEERQTERRSCATDQCIERVPREAHVVGGEDLIRRQMYSWYVGLLNRSSQNARTERRRLILPPRASRASSQMTTAGT